MSKKTCTASQGCGLTKSMDCFVKPVTARQPDLCDDCYYKITRAANKKARIKRASIINRETPLDIAINMMMGRAWV